MMRKIISEVYNLKVAFPTKTCGQITSFFYYIEIQAYNIIL